MMSARELFFDDDEVIVSKTDLKGKIIYANQTFAKLAGVKPKDALGQAHSFVRHPDMPRCIFKLLWDGVSSGSEIFAYVINRSVQGDYYWVFAHVTPSFDSKGVITGYHSNRRVPNRKIIDTIIIPLYKKLVEIETTAGARKEGLEASFAYLQKLVSDSGKEYNHFIMSLGAGDVS